MRAVRFASVGILMLAIGSGPARAQNVNPYDSGGNPYLFLIREPEVWSELKLTEKQRQALTAVNAKVDGPLLSLRNWPNEAADKKFVELVSETEQGAKRILSDEQQLRLQQICLRVQGIDCLLVPPIAEGLRLSAEQKSTLTRIVNDTRAAVLELRKQADSGKPREPLEKEYARKVADKQKQMLAELDDKQREQLNNLLGKSFDRSRIGKFSFKAPELATGGEWINSKPLTLAGLKGQVVAIQIWAFG